MGNPVVHFEIVGKDPHELQRFYSQAFGWRMEGGLPADVPGGPIFALFTDPAGNLVGLLKAGSGQGAR